MHLLLHCLMAFALGWWFGKEVRRFQRGDGEPFNLVVASVANVINVVVGGM